MHRLQKDFYLGRLSPHIGVNRQIPQKSTDLHTHEFGELVIIVGGAALHITDTGQYPVATGDVFLIQGDQRHGYEATPDFALINILFDPERLQLPMYDLRTMPGYHALTRLEPAYRQRHRFASRLQISTAALSRVMGWVEALDKEVTRRAPGSTFMAAAIFMQMLGYLCRCYSDVATHSGRALLRLATAISHIEAHYDQPLSLPELADMAHMSRSSFFRSFREALGHSPVEHLNHVRIARACDLLRQGALNVTQIAYRVGFADSNYFARQFRKVMGCSPREFRTAAEPA